MTKIEIYPKCPKPKWMKVGATCHCLGEGNDTFIVEEVLDVAALLRGHGLESFGKLYKTIPELERRRGWKEQ